MSDRKEYQRQYHSKNSAAAAERKEAERERKERIRSYWYGKLVLNRDMKVLIRDCTPEQVEEGRIRYLKVLDEECEVVHLSSCEKNKCHNSDEGDDWK